MEGTCHISFPFNFFPCLEFFFRSYGKTSKKGATKGKGGKKKAQDPMTRKEWYDVVAPAVFHTRQCCKTLVNKTAGQKRSEDNLKGRIFEVNLADLNNGDETLGYRKMKLRVDHVQGRSCVTNFHGMSLTTDKLRSLIKKRCSLIEAKAAVKTTDGFVLRIFLIAFTERASKNQNKKNCYAQTSQIRQIRKRMIDITTSTLNKCDLQQCVKKFLNELPAKDIAKACRNIFPLRDVYIRKVKLLKQPKFDQGKLLEAHGNEIPVSKEETGLPVSTA